MKVLLISNMYPSSQKPYAGIFVKNQYEYLQNHFNQSGEGSIEIFYMLRTFTSPFMSIVKYLKAFLRFIPYLGRSYDVIHVHYFFPLYLLAYAYKLFHPKSRIVVTFHGADIEKQVKGSNAGFFRKVSKKIDYTIAVGKDLADSIKEKLHVTTDLVMSAGIDQGVFYPENNSSEFSYDFTFVGSFIHRKGVDIVLDAIKEINSQSLRFCFVGSGDYRNQILELSKKYQITMKENLSQPELRSIYSQSKFFVFPSRNEPFGLVVTEAIYCGTPAIVANTGGLKEQVQNGYNGYILSENNPNVLANKIKEAAAMSPDAYAQLREQASLSNKQYSLEYTCEKLLDIYRSLS